MKKEFWLEKWQNKKIGFHKDTTHPLLVKYIDELKIKTGEAVFVPLCGKSIDMLWLNSQGYKVVGIELSELAIKQFFTENNLSYKKVNKGSFSLYTYENITIYQGDFFEMRKDYCTHIRAVYDRAALIALPDELVEKYVEKMREIIPENSSELLITLEFIRTTGSLGPPFTTPNDKVNHLFAKFASIRLLQELDIVEREDGFKAQGCDYVYERVYLITR